MRFLHPLLALLLGCAVLALSACGSADLEPAIAQDTFVAAATATSLSAFSTTAVTVTTVVAPSVASSAASPTPAPTFTAAPTAVPPVATLVVATATAVPAAKTTPTPPRLPAAPAGWHWELYATAVPVTHYITAEVHPDMSAGELELAYGLDDEPLPDLRPLPRVFLEQTAYQGSGLLPNGDLLQYATTRAPVKRGLVPYRFVITPREACDGHPRAGNETCSIPLKTAATTWQEGGPLVPVGSRIYIVELDLKVDINDVALTEGIPHKIDLYTGFVNNYRYERPNGSDIWILVQDGARAPQPPPMKPSEEDMSLVK